MLVDFEDIKVKRFSKLFDIMAMDGSCVIKNKCKYYLYYQNHSHTNHRFLTRNISAGGIFHKTSSFTTGTTNLDNLLPNVYRDSLVEHKVDTAKNRYVLIDPTMRQVNQGPIRPEFDDDFKQLRYRHYELKYCVKGIWMQLKRHLEVIAPNGDWWTSEIDELILPRSEYASNIKTQRNDHGITNNDIVIYGFPVFDTDVDIEVINFFNGNLYSVNPEDHFGCDSKNIYLHEYFENAYKGNYPAIALSNIIKGAINVGNGSGVLWDCSDVRDDFYRGDASAYCLATYSINLEKFVWITPVITFEIASTLYTDLLNKGFAIVDSELIILYYLCKYHPDLVSMEVR